MKEKIIVNTKDELKNLIELEIKNFGLEVDLNHLDVSHIEDMSSLFYKSSFNGDISGWDVSKVKDMGCMFYKSQFNQEICNWNVSSVKDMEEMFCKSQFNQDISCWDVYNVENMSYIFHNSEFNQDLTLWTPLSLNNSLDVFKVAICPKPYWAECHDNKDLINKITEFQQNYHLKQKLEQNLVINHQNKKIKL